MLLARGDVGAARAVLAAVESTQGRQQRGALMAQVGPVGAVLADLRARSGDRAADAVADAWIALVCFQQPAACAEGERDRALRAAREQASGAPETLRALALAAPDHRAAVELLRQAAARDPLSPWNGVISRQLSARRR
jgi:hypothetical protein